MNTSIKNGTKGTSSWTWKYIKREKEKICYNSFSNYTLSRYIHTYNIINSQNVMDVENLQLSRENNKKNLKLLYPVEYLSIYFKNNKIFIYMLNDALFSCEILLMHEWITIKKKTFCIKFVFIM